MLSKTTLGSMAQLYFHFLIIIKIFLKLLYKHQEQKKELQQPSVFLCLPKLFQRSMLV